MLSGPSSPSRVLTALNRGCQVIPTQCQNGKENEEHSHNDDLHNYLQFAPSDVWVFFSFQRNTPLSLPSLFVLVLRTMESSNYDWAVPLVEMQTHPVCLVAWLFARIHDIHVELMLEPGHDEISILLGKLVTAWRHTFCIFDQSLT